MKLFALSAFALSAALSFCALAQENQPAADAATLTQADLEEQNRLSDPNAIPSAADSIDEWAESVREGLRIESWGENNGKFFVFKSRATVVKSTDPDFGNSLANAYDMALMEVQEELAMLRFGRLLMEKAREFYNDRSSNNREFPSVAASRGTMEKVRTLLAKALDVASAKLDAELVKLGVSEAEVQAMTPVQKKTLFQEKFIATAIKTASGDISGVFPVQTAVKIDARGNAEVGVVAVLSDKTIQVAKDISMQRASLIRGRGRNLKEMIPQDTKQLLGDIGTRLVYDEDGTPVILSFAITSFVPDGDDDYINSRLRAATKQDCIDLADRWIAEVVNGQLSMETQTQNGQDVEKYIEKEMKSNAMTMEKVTKNILKIRSERSKVAASMKMQGISTLMSPKAFKLPNGQQMFGVVRCWKYSTLRTVKNFNEGNYNRPAPQAKPAAPQKPAPGSYQGRKFNDVEDF